MELNLTSILAQQMEKEEARGDFYDFALSHFHHVERDWKEDAVHVSDYSVSLSIEQGGTPPVHLWKRIHGREKKEQKPGQQLMWHQGNMLEEFTIYLIHKQLEGGSIGWDYHSTQHIVSDYLPNDDIGYCDLVLRDPFGNLVPVEIKTRRGRSFQYSDGPKLSDVTQLQGYGYALDAEYGYVLILDREGQNFAEHHKIEFGDLDRQVPEMSEKANHIAQLDEKPYELSPSFKRHENKGPDRISLDIPWQADYCDFEDCCEIADEYGDGRGNILKVDDKGNITKVWDDFKDDPIVDEVVNLIERGEL